VVVLIIEISDFNLGLVDVEREPPILGDEQAPGARVDA